jgi:RNA-directed DNA polymerase
MPSDSVETGGPRSGEGRKARAAFEGALLHEGRTIETSQDAAAFLGVGHGAMLYALYRSSDAERYTPFEIPKRSGGMRLIHSPCGLTRQMQEKLGPVIRDAYKAHPAAHGFVPERSILSNAKLHVGQKLVFNVDLQDFFPTINFGRVRGLFMAPPFRLGPAAATVFAQLCTHRNGLPQGAPTSPFLSNFIAADLDRRLARLARENGARYSRYADDITFSSNQATMPAAIAVQVQGAEGKLAAAAGDALERAIGASGFRINPAKVRLQTRHMRQSVTGLSVNERANVLRKRVRRLRAMLHAWEKFGLEAAAAHHFLKYRGLRSLPEKAGRQYRSAVYGQLSFLKMVRGADDAMFLNLAAKVLKLDPNPSKFLRAMVFGADDYDVFISHASEDKEAIARPVFEACAKLGLKAFLDEAHIGWGQSFTTKINTALGSARTVLAIISPVSVTKEWPVVEVNTALSLEVTGQKKVVPLLAGSPDLTRLPLVGGKDAMVWTGDAMAVARRLKAAASGDAPRRPAGTPSGPPRGLATTAVPPVTRTQPAPAQGGDFWSRQPPEKPAPAKKRSWWERLFGR